MLSRRLVTWLLWLAARVAGRRRSPWRQLEDSAAAREALSVVEDPTCHAKPHAGYAGDGAVVWGLNFKLSSASECCRACQAHASVCGRPGSAEVAWWPEKPRQTCKRGSRPSPSSTPPPRCSGQSSAAGLVLHKPMSRNNRVLNRQWLEVSAIRILTRSEREKSIALRASVFSGCFLREIAGAIGQAR